MGLKKKMELKKFIILVLLIILPCCGIEDYSYDDYYYDDCDYFCEDICNYCHYYQSDVLSCESHCNVECSIHGCGYLDSLTCTELVDELCM
jgi:hypothetical protein